MHFHSIFFFLMHFHSFFLMHFHSIFFLLSIQSMQFNYVSANVIRRTFLFIRKCSLDVFPFSSYATGAATVTPLAPVLVTPLVLQQFHRFCSSSYATCAAEDTGYSQQQLRHLYAPAVVTSLVLAAVTLMCLQQLNHSCCSRYATCTYSSYATCVRSSYPTCLCSSCSTYVCSSYVTGSCSSYANCVCISYAICAASVTLFALHKLRYLCCSRLYIRVGRKRLFFQTSSG